MEVMGRLGNIDPSTSHLSRMIQKTTFSLSDFLSLDGDLRGDILEIAQSPEKQFTEDPSKEKFIMPPTSNFHPPPFVTGVDPTISSANFSHSTQIPLISNPPILAPPPTPLSSLVQPLPTYRPRTSTPFTHSIHFPPQSLKPEKSSPNYSPPEHHYFPPPLAHEKDCFPRQAPLPLKRPRDKDAAPDSQPQTKKRLLS